MKLFKWFKQPDEQLKVIQAKVDKYKENLLAERTAWSCLIEKKLDYYVLQDIVNHVSNTRVTIQVTLKDGSSLLIVPKADDKISAALSKSLNDETGTIYDELDIYTKKLQ